MIGLFSIAIFKYVLFEALIDLRSIGIFIFYSSSYIHIQHEENYKEYTIGIHILIFNIHFRILTFV